MIAPETQAQKSLPLAQRPGLRQLIKFGIVGASSTIVNFAVLNLMLAMHQNRYAAETVAFLVSVVNGYYWNKRWTFKAAPVKAAHTQFIQFLLVNLVAWGLDLLIIKLLSVPLERSLHLSTAHWTMVIATNLAQLVATGVTVFWNFFANRLWTFKH